MKEFLLYEDEKSGNFLLEYSLQIRAVLGDDMMHMLMTIRVKNCWIDFWRCLIRPDCTRRGAACMFGKGDQNG